jgi:hypothetical protein
MTFSIYFIIDIFHFRVLAGILSHPEVDNLIR